MNAPYTVREFLDASLNQTHRAAELESLTQRFTGQPLADTVTGLRHALGGGISTEQARRLHILISHLYHRCNADFPLTTNLRAEVGQALTRRGTTSTRT